MSDFRVLVLGGYGFFGRRLVQRLSRIPDLEVLVGGRSLASGHSFVQGIQSTSLNPIKAVAVDCQASCFEDSLRKLTPNIVINASGPFQGSDYRVPAACVASGIHYADLADGREYVIGIKCLHESALAAGVTVTAGASSVPALSSAAADSLAKDLSIVHSIDIGISPGNRTERGLSTVRAILTYCGKSLPAPAGSQVFGWTGTRQHNYPAPVGSRLLSPCDVPDLGLFPMRYGTPDVRFGAGLELQLLHRGMNAMAWMARSGLVRDWSRHATLLKWAADLFRHRGCDAGAMHVSVQGLDRDGSRVTRTWQLVATDGDGPFVPTLAAAAFVRKIQAGALPPGAQACVGLLTLSDFMLEIDGLSIRTEVLS